MDDLFIAICVIIIAIAVCAGLVKASTTLQINTQKEINNRWVAMVEKDGLTHHYYFYDTAGVLRNVVDSALVWTK